MNAAPARRQVTKAAHSIRLIQSLRRTSRGMRRAMFSVSRGGCITPLIQSQFLGICFCSQR
jgi:hypothetical protein